MTTPEASQSQPLATSEQAASLLAQVGELAVLRGDGTSYELNGSGAPAEVLAHFPQSDPTSMAEYETFRVEQNFDPATGAPKQLGTVAVVSFTRTERRDRNLSYVTNVDYAINTPDGGKTYGINRHISGYETGPHKKLGADALATTLEAVSNPDIAIPQQAAHDQVLAEEQALGLHDVTAKEADQIINAVVQLKPLSAQ